MEPETCTAAKGKDADEDQNVSDPSTGDKADQDQQIFIGELDVYWYKLILVLKEVHAAFAPIVENKIKRLQEKSQTDFGRQLCKEATAEDIMPTRPNMAQFKHNCPGTPVRCQSLLNIIKGHSTDSVPFFEMLKGTDPQNWLKSPFEFARLFLENYLKCKLKDFRDCDITALCSIINRCKSLNQMVGSKIHAVREARNTTFHCSRMKISKQETESIIDAMLDFLQHINSLKNTDEVTKAIERIELVKSSDIIRLRQGKDAIQMWLPRAREELEHTLDVANNLHENIICAENDIARLSSEVAATINKGEEPKFEEKTLTEKQPDETRMWKQKYEDLVKLLQDEKERKRELEKQNEELKKRLGLINVDLSAPRGSLKRSVSSPECSQPKKFKPEDSPDGQKEKSACPVKETMIVAGSKFRLF